MMALREVIFMPEENGAKARRVRMPGFLVNDEVGLGDVLKSVTSTVGVRPCGGCNRRAAAMNRRVVLYGRVSPKP